MTKYTAKVHRKGLIVIPAELRKKYGIKEGSEVILIDEGSRIILLPKCSLKDLYGAAREHSETIDEIIKEIHEERKRETSP